MVRKTWLSPYAAVWKARFPEADVPFGQMARYLKPLIEAHPSARVCAELEGFLAQTEPRYLSLAKFAATFGSWTPCPHTEMERTLVRQSGGAYMWEARCVKCQTIVPRSVERPMCAIHPDRPSVGEVSRVKCCRECFDNG